MQNTTMLRAFEPKDMEQVIDLLQDVSVFRPRLDALDVQAHTFSTQLNSYSCVAIRDDRLVAFGSVFILGRVRGGKSGVIEDMVVASGMRGQGIGRQVLEKLLEESRARGCFKVTLESSVLAEPFYRALGFQAAGKVMKFLYE